MQQESHLGEERLTLLTEQQTVSSKNMMRSFLYSSRVLQNILLVLVIAHHCVSHSTRRCRAPSVSRPGTGVTGIRSNDHIQPWQCQQVMAWRHLGENFFPRFITEVRCSNSTCLGGQAFCRPVNINMKVLKAIDDSDCADPLLPTTLRSNWAFDDISVPVYCECSSV